MTRGQLPQRAGSLGLNGGGAAERTRFLTSLDSIKVDTSVTNNHIQKSTSKMIHTTLTFESAAGREKPTHGHQR